MTYEEFLRNWFVETNNNEMFDLWEDHPFTNALEAAGWTVENASDMTTPVTKSKGSASVTAVFKYNGSWKSIESISITADGVDVASEEIGTIDAVDALLGTGLDAASKKAEELKKRKLVTVANLQKALEDYDERKGTAVEDGEPAEGKNKVFVDGSGRVYARNIQLARQSGLDGEKSDRQRADNRLSDEIAKKADKEHTHKTADITDLPNYARSVNGEEPDADGNVEIDIDAVVEVAELPAETKKKVYLVPEVTTEKTVVDCSSVESIMAGVATWLTGETQHPSTVEEFIKALKATTADKGTVTDKYGGVKVDLSSPGFVAGTKFLEVSADVSPYTSCKLFDKSGNLIGTGFTDSRVSFTRDSNFIFGFRKFTTQDYDSGWVDGYYKSGNAYMGELTLSSSMTLGEDSRTPPAVYAKSVELATKEALSEATSGADEKAAALGERIGAVESSVTTAKSDIAAMKSDISTAKTNITAMKSNITEAQANITTAQSDIATAQNDITKAQGDIEAVTSEVETVKADVAALETKVAASSDASGKNDTITVSDADSAVSDDTGILSGESGENPKGLLRFAASKIWDYIRGKIRGVLGVDKVSNFIRLNYDVQCNESIENPGFKVDRFGNMATRNVRNGTLSFTSVKGKNVVSTDISEMYNSNYILIFEVTQGANLIERQILVQSKTQKSFSIIVYVTEEDSLIKINYTALPIYPM